MAEQRGAPAAEIDAHKPASGLRWPPWGIVLVAARGEPRHICSPDLAVQESCTIGAVWLMATETTYTSLRANLAGVLDQVVDQRQTVIVRRRGSRDVALLPADELAGLVETAHLLRSPRNARRLLAALQRAGRRTAKPESVADLRREILGEAGR